jgi:hypothetical protein
MLPEAPIAGASLNLLKPSVDAGFRIAFRVD